MVCKHADKGLGVWDTLSTGKSITFLSVFAVLFAAEGRYVPEDSGKEPAQGCAHQRRRGA